MTESPIPSAVSRPVEGSDAVVVLRNAVKRFGATTALAGASLTIERGESVGLLGRNGAGKSTVVKLSLIHI